MREFVGKWHRTGNKNESISCNRISNTSVGCMVPDNGVLKYAEFDIDGASISLDTDHDIQGGFVKENKVISGDKRNSAGSKMSGMI